jgi:hypothetical protein
VNATSALPVPPRIRVGYDSAVAGHVGMCWAKVCSITSYPSSGHPRIDSV